MPQESRKNVCKNGARPGYSRCHNHLPKIVGQELVIKCKMSMKIRHLIKNMDQSTQVCFFTIETISVFAFILHIVQFSCDDDDVDGLLG